MADDRTVRNGSDRDRINVNQDHELRDWAKRLRTTPQALKDAVKAVGDRVTEVRTRLSDGRKPAQRSSGESKSR
jgi:hypothetical protein